MTDSASTLTTETYSNDLTSYLTQTNSLGVITGMPAADTVDSGTRATTTSTTSTTSDDEPVMSALTIMTSSALLIGSAQPVSSSTPTLNTLDPKPTASSTTKSASSSDLQASTSATRAAASSSLSELSAEASRSASGTRQASKSSSTAPPTKTAEDNDTSASTTPTPTSKDDSHDSGGLSTGAQAGIGAACGLLGLAALLVIAFLLMKRRKRRQARKPSEVQHGDFPDDPKAKVAAPMVQDYVPFAELEAQEIKREMPGSYVYPVELEGRDIREMR
jgi:hypothetical protein